MSKIMVKRQSGVESYFLVISKQAERSKQNKNVMTTDPSAAADHLFSNTRSM